MRRVVKFDVAAGTPHTGTTTEGSIARYAFGVSELLPGRVIEARCAARVTGTSAGDTCTVRVRFGTSATVTANTAIMTGDAIATSSGDVFIAQVWFDVQSAVRYVFSTLVDNPHATGATRDTDSSVVIYTATADVAYYLDITCDWNTSSGTNSIQSESWVVFEDEV
jgi:hypothetical protein